MEAAVTGSLERLAEPAERRDAGADLRVPFPVEVRCASDVRGGTRRYLALNLARGGLFLITVLPLEVGSLLKVTVALPDGHAPLEVLARVAWTRPASRARETPGGMGIRFIDLAEADRRRLEAFVP